MGNTNSLRSVAALLLTLASFASAQAAPVTWELSLNQNNGTEQGSGYTNSYVFDAAGESLNVTAWADVNTGSLESANVTWRNQGVGVCNTSERSDLADCQSRGGQRQTDNRGNGQQDWLLLFLPSDAIFESIVIDPQGNRDRDVTYWVGTLADAALLDGASYADLAGLGFGAQTDIANSTGGAALTLSLGGATGNVILFGADLGGNNDRFMVKELTATLVPLPPAVFLFGSAILLLGRLRNRRAP